MCVEAARGVCVAMCVCACCHRAGGGEVVWSTGGLVLGWHESGRKAVVCGGGGVGASLVVMG